MERDLGPKDPRPANVGQTLLRRPTRLARGRYGPTIRKSVEQVTHLDGYGNSAWLDS